ncbi:MAG: cyclic nucleotide-binding domain-containing protein, partial [Leptospira sp.]|nr:cyclic nucleotide-binding domain-containing protein [Leptospira sp.]
MESNEEILKAIYLFTNFTKDELHNLGSKAKHIVLNPRDVLFSEGNEASSFYVVRYGTLKILTHTRQGDDVALTTIGAGDYFGELPFLFHEKRSATVEAIEKTELLEF